MYFQSTLQLSLQLPICVKYFLKVLFFLCFLFAAISTSTSRETTPESEDEDEDLAGGDEDEEEEDDFAEEESFAQIGSPDHPCRSPKTPLSRASSRNEEELRESYGRCFRELLHPNQVRLQISISTLSLIHI